MSACRRVRLSSCVETCRSTHRPPHGHAGAGGVDSAAVQLAHAAGARVFATASGAKRDAVMALGADVVVDHRSEDFQAVVLDATGGRGVDVVIDFMGAPSLERNVRSLAEGGRLVCVGLPGWRRARCAR